MIYRESHGLSKISTNCKLLSKKGLDFFCSKKQNILTTGYVGGYKRTLGTLSEKKCSFNSLGRNIICKFYTETYILHILVMKIVLVNLHAIVPDHPHRLFFEHLSFKPMGIVSFWAKYKTCYLKKLYCLQKLDPSKGNRR